MVGINYVDNIYYSDIAFDLFHHGHYSILKRSKNYGMELYVGVSTDNLNILKNKQSIHNLEQRKNDVFNTSFSNLVFDEESLELKQKYIKKI